MLLHRLEQRALRLGRGAVDFVGEHQLRKDRAALKAELAGLAVEDRHAEHVGGQQVAGELHALKRQAERLGDARARGWSCPRPGMSSISRWPRASRQARHRRICASLPRITRLSWASTASICGLRRVHWSLERGHPGDLGRQLADFRAQFRKPLLVLGDDLRRCVLGELGCCPAWPPICSSSASALRCRLARRSSSAAGSIRPAMGTNISSVPEQGNGGNRRRLRRRQHARRLDAGETHQIVHDCGRDTRYRSAPAFCSSTSSLRLGAMSISPRICRTPRMKSITQRISGSARASASIAVGAREFARA